MAVVIPEKIVRFLERATVGIGGTRDGHLVPHVHRVSGWSVSDDRKIMTCLIAPQFAAHLLPSLEDNGQFALTVSEVPSHETYQFKGDFTGSRGIERADMMLCLAQRKRFADAIGALFGFAKNALEAYVATPSVAIDFTIREIFVQTPGPDAGKKMLPAPNHGDVES